MTSYFSLGENELSFVVPSELGRLVLMRSLLVLESNKLSSTLPTQLGLRLR